MFDAIDVASIPLNAAAAAGYCDGSWPTILDLKARLPHAHILSIAVFAVDDADCLDIETGDATPGDAPDWVRRQQARGVYRPTLYANASTMPAVVERLTWAGIGLSEVRLWSAHYTYVAHICGPDSCAYPGVPACDGTQFTDTALGLSLDESLLLDDFFAGPPKPPHHSASLVAGDDMFALTEGAGATVALPVPKAVLGISAAGVPTAQAPSVIRFCTNAPAVVEAMMGNSGTWTSLAIDYGRGPNEIVLPPGTTEIKIKRTDSGTNVITGDFA